jgi:hypothetical protein
MRYVLTLEQYTTVLKNESFVGDTIVCDKCKWSWAKDDAGEHPLTCKCGHTNELNEKKSPYDRETLLHYKGAYEKGKEIPFGVKSSLIAQGMIAREGGEDEGKKVKSPEYSSEDHEMQHYSGVWEKTEDEGEGKSSETEKGKKVKGEYLTADTKKERELMKKEIDKHSKKDPDDPSSYKDWPADYKGGDTKGEPHDTKESPATKAYKKMYGDKKDESVVNEDSKIETALKNKSDETGIPYGILKQVHDRGMAAWRTGHKPGTPQAAWAMGRVNSFITGEGGARKADSDLWDDYKKKK